MAVKRPLVKLVGCDARWRDLLLALVFDSGRDSEHDRAIRTAMMVGWMSIELGLTRKQAIELAMAGLVYSSERPTAENLHRQVELRQSRERNVLRMALVHEARMTDVSTYSYDPSLASRLIAFAHAVEKPKHFADVFRRWSEHS